LENLAYVANEKEEYQIDIEVCYDCWMNETNAEISN
jgi:hypothetical protein